MAERQPPIELPEKKEREPKIEYRFFFAPHLTAEDRKGLKEEFEKADIYVPEMANWDATFLRELQAISGGWRNPEERWKSGTLHGEEMKMIYNSRKPIILADISAATMEEQSIAIEIERAQILEAFAEEDFLHGDLNGCLVKMRQAGERYVKAQLKREAVIKENLKTKIKKFLQKNPAYGLRPKLKILVNLGALHTSIFIDMKKAGEEVKRKFKIMPYIWGMSTEWTRRVIFGKEISDEFLAKVVVDELLMKVFANKFSDTLRLTSFSRKLVDKLTFEDIEEISKKAGRSGGQIDIVEELESRGIKVPKTEEEMDKLVGPYKK